MNDHVTISTFQLFKLFPDEESAKFKLEVMNRMPKHLRYTILTMYARGSK